MARAVNYAASMKTTTKKHKLDLARESLVSLSTCDYSRVRSLVDQAVAIAKPRNVTVSLPSLRLDSFSVELADMVAETRRSGLTFARGHQQVDPRRGSDQHVVGGV